MSNFDSASVLKNLRIQELLDLIGTEESFINSHTENVNLYQKELNELFQQ
mgnify:CR=1 FL=1